MTTAETDVMDKYIKQMEEVKKRIDVAGAFVRGEINSRYLATTAESAALQLRKMLELIALSSLVANCEQYEKHHGDFKKDWNVKKILRKLEKVNPKFYPVPTKQKQISRGLYNSPEIQSGYLTREDFTVLYNKCSDILHTSNPFAEQRNPNLTDFLWKEVPEWMDKIMTLLNHHHIRLIDDSRMYIVLMQEKNDGNVHMYKFERIST